MGVLQQNQMNSLLMDLPEIAPYPGPVHVLGNPMAQASYYSFMGWKCNVMLWQNSHTLHYIEMASVAVIYGGKFVHYA